MSHILKSTHGDFEYFWFKCLQNYFPEPLIEAVQSLKVSKIYIEYFWFDFSKIIFPEPLIGAHNDGGPSGSPGSPAWDCRCNN